MASMASMSSMSSIGHAIRKGGRLAELLIVDLINSTDSTSTSFIQNVYKSLNIDYPLRPPDRAFCARSADHENSKTDIKLYNGDALVANIQVKKGPARFLKKTESFFHSRKTGNQIHAGSYSMFADTIALSDEVTEMFRKLCKETRGFSTYTITEQRDLIKEIEDKKEVIGNFFVKGISSDHVPDIHVIVNISCDSKLKSYTIINTTTFVKWLMDGPVEIVSGGMHLGHLRIQRKGGDSGRKSADRLQACFSIPELNTCSRLHHIHTFHCYI